jgi:hypothetical protein
MTSRRDRDLAGRFPSGSDARIRTVRHRWGPKGKPVSRDRDVGKHRSGSQKEATPGSPGKMHPRQAQYRPSGPRRATSTARTCRGCHFGERMRLSRVCQSESTAQVREGHRWRFCHARMNVLDGPRHRTEHIGHTPERLLVPRRPSASSGRGSRPSGSEERMNSCTKSIPCSVAQLGC